MYVIRVLLLASLARAAYIRHDAAGQQLPAPPENIANGTAPAIPFPSSPTSLDVVSRETIWVVLSVCVPVPMAALFLLCIGVNAKSRWDSLHQEELSIDDQVEFYRSSELTGLRVLGQIFIFGSHLNNWVVIWNTALCCLMWICLTCCVRLIIDNAQELDDTSITFVSTYLNAFLPFFFSLYLKTMFTRWWDIRTKGLGAIYSASADIIMCVKAFCPQEQFKPHLQALIRYFKLINALTWGIASSRDGGKMYLQTFIDEGLLEADEEAALQKCTGNKAQLVWEWVFDILVELHNNKHIDRNGLRDLQSFVVRGRGGVQATFAIIDTQLPFSWVHLMSFLVGANALIVILKCSIASAKSMHVLEHGCRLTASAGLICATDAADVPLQLFAQMVQVVLTPFVHFGFLEFSNDLQNPFGSNPSDFPQKLYAKKLDHQLQGFDAVRGAGWNESKAKPEESKVELDKKE